MVGMGLELEGPKDHSREKEKIIRKILNNVETVRTIAWERLCVLITRPITYFRQSYFRGGRTGGSSELFGSVWTGNKV